MRFARPLVFSLLVACGSDDPEKNTPLDPADMDAGLPTGTAEASVPPSTRPDGASPSADGSLADAVTDAAAFDASPADASLDAARDAEVDAAPNAPDAAPSVPDAALPPTACDPSTAPAVGKLGLQTVVSGQGLAYLTDAVQPPGSDDWYLVQQNGYVRILRDGALLPDPYLDVHTEINLANDAIYEDRGLVSIEFARDWATSGRFFVSFTPNRGAETNLDQLRVYHRLPADSAPVREPDILSLRGSHIDAPTLGDYTTNIHNGGRVTWGPDGMLYLAMGDGGGVQCGDSEPGAAQDPGSLFGKLLRLDLANPPSYAAADNPFVGSGDGRVLHYGLRNSFRFSFDQNGDLYLGDVGQNTYEEIDFAPAGAKGLNFGWATFEGNERPLCSRPLRAGSSATPPIFVADRTAGATSPFSDYNAIIGGVVYRGKKLPQLQGVYLFGGFRGARLGALKQCGSTTSPVTPVTKACNPNTPNEACLRTLDAGPAFSELRAIVQDHEGELFIVANRNTLFKLVPLP